MVDQLANEYANQPVVFIEYPAEGTPYLYNARRSKYWIALNDTSSTFPFIMLNSGHQVTNTTLIGGVGNFYSGFKTMIDAELPRAPQAEVSAQYTRVGDHYDVDVRVTNHSGVTLSSASNAASVFMVVYEEVKVGVTSRYVRAVVERSIDVPLADGESLTYLMKTENLTGMDWSKLGIVAWVDYKPSGSAKYDMLQAAKGVPTPALALSPAPLRFWIDVDDPHFVTQSLRVTSAASGWTYEVIGHSPWLSVNPGSGPVGSPLQVTASAGTLDPGWHDGSITLHITGPGVDFLRSAEARLYYGEVSFVYGPNIMK